MRPGNVNADRTGKGGCIHHSNIGSLDDVSMRNEQWPVPVSVPVLEDGVSTRSTNHITVQSDIQHEVTFL
jgi:hypothetical protein